MTSPRSKFDKDAELGVHTITDGNYRSYEKRRLKKDPCQTCGARDKEDGGAVQLSRCKGCQKADWKSHKEYCQIIPVVNATQELITGFFVHPPLLHHFRVALILHLGIASKPDPTKSWIIDVPVYLFPTSSSDAVPLYTGPWRDVDEKRDMQGYFHIKMGGKKQLDVALRLSKQDPDMDIMVRIWREGRKAAEAFGRKDNPVVVANFIYEHQQIHLGFELTKDAFETANGRSPPPELAIPRSEDKDAVNSTQSVLNDINAYIKGDKENKLKLRATMRESDKEVVRQMGRQMGRRRD
ncbi:hypothetical protein NLJ89_g1085 [Agrocybe chaxingu]|uniref:DUF8205 domain-containing protein n=1 Tax=Agrocybe chaxingu TaxID=84603 RepID=A0A9W8N0L4_9AGAR|nr:hypothetical protein NLJ89_g1085 [Agrocybe chaxingu]